jgi:hypothetical protein
VGLPLPKLDDRTFDDLAAEARALIPAVQPEWTDHNPSDPGITLLELLAWLTEMLIYRADQVPEDHVRAFLRLLNGPGQEPEGDLDAQVAATIQLLRTEWRAVTAADFERLALEAAPELIAAHTVPHLDLSGATLAERALPRPAHLSVLLLLEDGADADAVHGAVARDLEPRRMLTTRLVVTAPLWTPVEVSVLLAYRADVPRAQAEAAARQALIAFLDARTGGPDADGWEWGRPVYAGELTAALEGLPGIEYVVDLILDSRCGAGVRRCVRGIPRVHESGSLVGLELGEGCLPGPGPPDVDVRGGMDYVAVTAIVPITPRANADLPSVRSRVLRAVRDLAWPGRGWPPPGEPILAADRVAAAARGVTGVAAVGTVTLEAVDPARIRVTMQGVQYAWVDSHELIDLTVEVVT